MAVGSASKVENPIYKAKPTAISVIGRNRYLSLEFFFHRLKLKYLGVMAAPQRQRQFVEQYKIVKKA